MKQLRAFGRFWWDFVVGDDWRLALSALVALALVAVLSHNTAMSTWWIAPALIFTVLVASLARSTPR